MPFASVGVCTVLWSKTLVASASVATVDTLCDHIAMPSSPVFRKKLFCTREFVTPRRKFIPSAITSATIVFRTVRLFSGPSNHSPTLVWWMYRPSIVESLSAPPTPLTWSVSIRSRTSPSMAKFERWTLLLPPSSTYLP